MTCEIWFWEDWTSKSRFRSFSFIPEINWGFLIISISFTFRNCIKWNWIWGKNTSLGMKIISNELHLRYLIFWSDSLKSSLQSADVYLWKKYTFGTEGTCEPSSEPDMIITLTRFLNHDHFYLFKIFWKK